MNEPEKPSEYEENMPDKPDKNHRKIPFDSSLIDITRPLLAIAHPALGNIAILGWVGRGEDNKIIRQPAIWLHPDMNDDTVYNLSYEGISWYISPGDTYLRKTNIIYPSNGSVAKMQPNKKHYFNNYGCMTPNYSFTIDVNNASMIMNNVSIFNSNYSIGCMLNLRASFDGLMNDENINGNVIVLCTIDTIG